MPKPNSNCGTVILPYKVFVRDAFMKKFPNLSTLKLDIKELIVCKQVQRSHTEEYSSQQNEYEYVWKWKVPGLVNTINSQYY